MNGRGGVSCHLSNLCDGHIIVVMKDQKPSAPKRARKAAAGSSSTSSSIAAADFKARCLELMDRVRETGVEYIVTKHGAPVAKLVPHTSPDRKPLFGSMKGTVLKFERPLEPIDADWDINNRD
jgi:prevent-host-death family protein